MKKIIMLALAAALVFGGTALAEDAKKPIAGHGVGGAFALVDGDGKPVTEKSWPGKHKLVFFGFTNCPEICPVTLDKIAAALDKLGGEAEKIQTLFITTDPSRDTPQVVKDYAAKFHKSIRGLTGSEEQVKAAIQAYKVYSSKREGETKDDYMMDHSSYIYLMSPDDRMLGILGGSATADDIVRKIKENL